MPKRKAIESSDSANKTSTEPTRGRQHFILLILIVQDTTDILLHIVH